MIQITIYTTDNCPGCLQAKKYLSQKEYEFNEVNITQDIAKQQEMIILTGGHRRVPVIVIDKDGDTQVILGFDQQELDQVLSN